MSTLNFPTSPSLNDTYSFGTKTWIWNGTGWQLQATGAINNTHLTISPQLRVSLPLSLPTALSRQ